MQPAFQPITFPLALICASHKAIYDIKDLIICPPRGEQERFAILLVKD